MKTGLVYQAGRLMMFLNIGFVRLSVLSFPLGADPSEEDWKLLADICKRKNHFPVFDMAYQVRRSHLTWFFRYMDLLCNSPNSLEYSWICYFLKMLNRKSGFKPEKTQR